MEGIGARRNALGHPGQEPREPHAHGTAEAAERDAFAS